MAGPALVDGVLLGLLRSVGWSWIDAQLASFLVGLSALVLLTWIVHRRTPGPSPRPALVPDILVALVTLALRGGLLATLVRLGLDSTPVLVAGALLTWPLLARCRSGLSEPWGVVETGGDVVVIRLAMTFTAVSLLLRVLYLFPVELMHEEAYYWLYARHLDFGYYDHPPFVGAMIWAGTQLAGDTELGVRLLAPLLWAGGAAFVFALTRRIFDRVVAWVAVALFAMLPFLFVAGLVAFPDTALIFCWAGSVYFLHRQLVDDAPHAWIGVGVFIGLGLLAKFTIVLLGLAAVLFALTHARTRRVFLRWQPYAAVALALLVFSPVLAWNADHEWASFARQSTSRLSSGFKFKLPALLLFAGVHLLPLGVIGIWQTVKDWWRGRSAPAAQQDAPLYRARQLAIWLMLVPLTVFVLASLFRNTKFNWTAPIWIPLLPFLAAGVLIPAASAVAAAGRRLSGHAAVAGIGTLVFFAVGLYHLGLGLPGVPYVKGLGGVGWRTAGIQLEAMADAHRREDGTRPLVVGINGDTTPSWISFYRSLAAGPQGRDRAVAETVGGHLFGEPDGMFAWWFPIPNPPSEHDALLLVSDEAYELEETRIEKRIDRGGPVLNVFMEKNGRSAGVYYARWVYGYRGP